MKHKRADRTDWPRVTRKRFVQQHMQTADFTGHIVLLCIDAVREPLWIKHDGQNVCLADAGYTWLQHFPQGSHHALSSFFDAQGQLIEHYIDICKRYYLDEHGTLWYDDLYLDLNVSPVGEFTLKDVDELDAALHSGDVTALDYELAWREAHRLMIALEEDLFPLLWMSEAHRAHLLKSV